MDNLNALSLKESKSVILKEPKEVEIKKKIMGMKEQIKKEKEQLIRRNTESMKGKKTSTPFTRKIRH